MKFPLFTAGCLGCLICASSHAAPVPLPVAPSTLPSVCMWVPVLAYGVPYYAYVPVMPAQPSALSVAASPATSMPAPNPDQPNWFAPVPGWQALAAPPPGTPTYPCYPTSPYWTPTP